MFEYGKYPQQLSQFQLDERSLNPSLNCCINRWHEGKIWWLGLERIYFHSEGRNINISLNSSEKENRFDLKHRILCVILSWQFMIVVQLWYKLESKLTILGPFVGLEDIFFWRVFDASWSGKGIQVSMFCFATGLKLCGRSFIHLYVNMGTWKAFIYCLELDVASCD